MAEPFLAEIRIFPFNFAPRGWAWCDGTLMSIQQNTALFALLGTNYGGNGQTTFALPNLMGRAPMHPGQGQGTSMRTLGEMGGSESVTLLSPEMPSHSHALRACASDPADRFNPENASLARSNNGQAYGAAANLTPMAPTALDPAGGGNPHNNMMPYITYYFNIALQGIFPSRG